jgi:hypothetical protein
VAGRVLYVGKLVAMRQEDFDVVLEVVDDGSVCVKLLDERVANGKSV